MPIYAYRCTRCGHAQDVLRKVSDPPLSDCPACGADSFVKQVTAAALLFALNSKSTMYEMVQNAYNVTLAGAFIPLLAGAYWKRATTQGALFSIVLGIGCWLGATQVAADAMVPANLIGFFASIIGMVMGSLAPQLLGNRGHSIEAALKAARAQAHGHGHGHGTTQVQAPH